ncbi:MAG: hypothetical protein RSA10_01190 [Bacilli bacterium]
MNNALLKDTIKKYCSNIKRYEFHKNSVVFTDEYDKKYVAKPNNNNVLEIYNYLNSRGFGYLPRLEYCDDTGYIYDYIESVDTPSEQKISDLIKLDALLHNKTAYYKEMAIDEIKEMYDNLEERINNVFYYYDDLITMVESKVYMSPGEYLFARNVSTIFSCLNFCRSELDSWYDIVSTNSKKRVVFLHNNLDVDHLIRNDDNYLISWNNATRDLPIYDFIRLYKLNYDKYDFKDLYDEYIKKFPLLPEEKKLLFIILFIPEKIKFSDNEFQSCVDVRRLCEYLFKTDGLFMKYQTKNSEKQEHQVNEQQEHLKSAT